MTTTQLKILGHRNGVTKAKKLDGAEVFLNGITGTPGQPGSAYPQFCHGRLSPHFKTLKDKFHQ